MSGIKSHPLTVGHVELFLHKINVNPKFYGKFQFYCYCYTENYNLGFARNVP